MSRLKIVLWLSLLVFTSSAFAYKFNWQKEKEEAEVNIWSSILTQDKNYALINHDNFLEYINWKDVIQLAYATRFQVIDNLPDEPAYQKELDMLAQFADHPKDQKTLQVDTQFHTPGKQVFYMKSIRPLYVDGYVKRFSIWVKSKDYPHMLELRMLDSLKREHRIKVGRLNFEGWRRLDVTLPQAFSTRNRRSNRPYRSQLLGLVIRSHKFAKRNSCQIIIDNLNFLVDRTEWTYPGSEISDDWGDFIGKKRIR